MLRLVGTDGTRSYAFDLTPGRHVLGRDVALPLYVDDGTVSRSHAAIEVDAQDEAVVSDLGSHNGTFINGVRIAGSVQVKPGDSIHFGRTEFRISADPSSAIRAGRSTAAALSDVDPERSMVVPVGEARKPLPSQVTSRPELLPVLSEMAREPDWSESREVLLERWLKLVNRVIPAERLAVLMTDDPGHEIRVAASILNAGHDPGRFTLSKTILNEILTRKDSLLITDSSSDVRFARQQSVIASRLRSAMAVPLLEENRVLGVLYADTSNPLHRYSEDYLRLMATFGNIIAARLLNYELVQERQERRIYEAELKRASAMQRNLLTRERPRVPGYLVATYQQPCESVGGDLYDLALLPTGKLVVSVADVSGKGMGAALLMSNILASFRILYELSPFSLSDAVRMVSRQLYRCSAAEDFATLFVGVVDPRSHKLTYVNAGHNPPLLLRADGRLEHLHASGTMIGAFEDVAWDEVSTGLAPGDMLFVYTDGVTEAQRGIEQYGEGRIEKLAAARRGLEPEKLLTAVMDDLGEFLQTTPYSDDVTMLALKRTS